MRGWVFEKQEVFAAQDSMLDMGSASDMFLSCRYLCRLRGEVWRWARCNIRCTYIILGAYRVAAWDDAEIADLRILADMYYQ